jgi:hypothetical protein
LVVSVLDVLFAGVDVDFYACATGVLLLRLFVAVLFVDVDLFTVLRRTSSVYEVSRRSAGLTLTAKDSLCSE